MKLEYYRILAELEMIYKKDLALIWYKTSYVQWMMFTEGHSVMHNLDKKLTVILIKPVKSIRNHDLCSYAKPFYFYLWLSTQQAHQVKKHRLVREINIFRAQLSLTSFFVNSMLCVTKRGKKLMINLF